MKIIHTFLLIIKLIILFPLLAQSFESDATIDEDFCGSSVLVMMDQIVGGLNKKHEISYFQGIDIVSIFYKKVFDKKNDFIIFVPL